MYANPVLFPQVTNRESFAPYIGIYDDADGSPVNLSGLTFQLEIRRLGFGSGHFASPTVPFYDDGPEASPVLTASLGNGITVVDVGVFQVVFSETQMRTLRAGTYSIACTASDGSPAGTRQLFLGRLPVLDGGVTN